MNTTVAEIAAIVGGTVIGDGSTPITGVNGIRQATSGDITFLASPRYTAYLEGTSAAAVVVAEDQELAGRIPSIRVPDPSAAFQRVAAWFSPPPVIPAPGVHPGAVVHDTARLGRAVSVGPLAVIEQGAVIGDECAVGAGAYIGPFSSLGGATRIHPHVTILAHSRIGRRVIIHSGTVIGSDGFGYEVDEQGVRTKIPQLGIVEIGDDVEIGAGVTVDRARFGRTRIGNGVKIDNLVQVAHNVVVGDHAVLVAQVAIAGSTVLEPHTMVAGQAGVAGHLVIGAGAVIAGRAGVTKDVPPKTFVSGFPAMPHARAQRLQAEMNRLPRLKKRVAELEQRLAQLEARG